MGSGVQPLLVRAQFFLILVVTLGKLVNLSSLSICKIGMLIVLTAQDRCASLLRTVRGTRKNAF